MVCRACLLSHRARLLHSCTTQQRVLANISFTDGPLLKTEGKLQAPGACAGILRAKVVVVADT